MTSRAHSLLALGRARSLQLDDPPEDDELDADDVIEQYEQQEMGYRYAATHSESAVTSLARSFKLLTPGSLPCKRTVPGAASFTHCPSSVSLARKYSALRRLLQQRARLQLVRDCCARVEQCAALVREVASAVEEEQHTWRAVCAQRLTAAPRWR